MQVSTFVVGASGNIGSSVAAQLEAKNHLVRRATRRAVAEGERSVRFDFDDPTTWARSVAGIDRVFLIPKTGDPYPDETLLPFIDACVAAGVRRIVFSTAMGLDQDWRVLCVAEDHLAASRMEYSILRPGWFIQNFSQGFLAPAINNGLIALPASSACRLSFVDTRDIAAVAVAALLSDTPAGEALLGGAHTLTGPESLSWDQTVHCLSAAVGHRVRYQSVDEAQWRNSMLSAGVRPYRVEQMLQMMQAMREGIYGSISDVVPSVLGRPAVSLAQFYAEHGE